MPAYLIAEQIIKDETKFEQYKNAVMSLIARSFPAFANGFWGGIARSVMLSAWI